MIRTKGEAGSVRVVEALRRMRAIMKDIRLLTTLRADKLKAKAKGSSGHRSSW